MRHTMLRSLLALAFIGPWSGHLRSQSAHAADAPNPSMQLDWLGGCWITPSGTAREVWTPAGDGLLFGFNTVSRDGTVGFFEQLRIEKTGTGWTFFAYPRGTGPTVFSASDQDAAPGARTVTFRNEAHDDPQVIRYARDGDTLTVTISLANGDNPRRWTFNPCTDG